MGNHMTKWNEIKVKTWSKHRISNTLKLKLLLVLKQLARIKKNLCMCINM